MSVERTQRLSNGIQKKLSGLSNNKTASNVPRISKVHDRLRSQNKEAYEPKLLSIGPYHRGKANLQDMEKYKLRYLQDLLDRSGETSPEIYISALTNLEEQARSFYADEISLGEDDFVEMMLLDGFFIIELLRKCHIPKLRIQEDDKIFHMEYLVIIIMVDLLLLENQVPFFILVQLHDMTKFTDQQENNNLIHLALILTRLVPSFGTIESGAIISINDHQDQIIHILDLVHKIWSSSFDQKIRLRDADRDSGDYYSLEYIKSASALEEIGIKFEKAMQNSSWLDITSENGVIKIPRLIVDDHTEYILRNLIAYEQYNILGHYRTYITDHAKLMDLFIDSPRDVEKLRHRKIIRNELGDDEVVSAMFNKLNKGAAFTGMWFCYGEVLREVNKFSSKKRNIWRAQLMRNYFKTPWSTISFLAAVVLLILTFLQTIFTILQ
ncbi:hypothetical protein ACH5RR_032847 [Cinchona calisaya]|uniref:Uncharacterized protein n=1 Tax=Cinchona calisaya TaxID=153742 RepID=A0ABD2YMT6_9GENT